MKSQTVLKIINPLLFIAVVVQFTGLFIQKFISAEWLYEMHEIVGYTIGILIVIHIIYNWAWIKNNIFKMNKKK